MKISYERLNQIIEEEVSRFKRLNEEETSNDPSVLSKSVATMSRPDLIKALIEKANTMTDVQLRDIVSRMK